jgi:hypothetical protein
MNAARVTTTFLAGFSFLGALAAPCAAWAGRWILTYEDNEYPFGLMDISSNGQILLMLQWLKASGPATARHRERVRVLDNSSRREIAVLHLKGGGFTSAVPGIASRPRLRTRASGE